MRPFTRLPSRRRRVPIRVRLLLLVVAVLLIPVPWMHVVGDDPFGAAWRLDGRLSVDGRTMDPPGQWSWLTVGRPPLVAEVLWDELRRGQEPPFRDLREASAAARPAVSEPVAAAVGLTRAGRDLQMRLTVEAIGAREPGYPERAVVTGLGGAAVTDRASWATARAHANEQGRTEFTTRTGRTYAVSGPQLPYEQVRLVDRAPPGLQASVVGWIGSTPPARWFRNLGLGSSHGMMVALVTYAEAAGVDLARGRHIAGTGGITGAGDIIPISGLGAKAEAARDNDVDVLVYPAEQKAVLTSFDARGMELIPVRTLDEAIGELGS